MEIMIAGLIGMLLHMGSWKEVWRSPLTRRPHIPLAKERIMNEQVVGSYLLVTGIICHKHIWEEPKRKERERESHHMVVHIYSIHQEKKKKTTKRERVALLLDRAMSFQVHPTWLWVIAGDAGSPLLLTHYCTLSYFFNYYCSLFSHFKDSTSHHATQKSISVLKINRFRLTLLPEMQLSSQSLICFERGRVCVCVFGNQPGWIHDEAEKHWWLT